MAAGAASVQLEVFPEMWHDFEMSSEGCGGAPHSLALAPLPVILSYKSEKSLCGTADHALGEGLTAYRLAAAFLKGGGRGGCRVVCGDDSSAPCENLAPVRWHLHYNSLPPVQSSVDCPGSYL